MSGVERITEVIYRVGDSSGLRRLWRGSTADLIPRCVPLTPAWQRPGEEPPALYTPGICYPSTLAAGRELSV